MAQQLESLLLEFIADTRALYSEMDRAVEYARTSGRKIEQAMGRMGVAGSNLGTIRPRVDHRPLTELNKHIEQKRTHVKDVQRWLDANPLKIRFDNSSVQNLKPVQLRFETTFAATGRTSNESNQQLSKLTEETKRNRQTAHETTSVSKAIQKELEKTPGKIAKEIQATKSGNALTNLATLPFRVVSTVWSQFSSAIGAGLSVGIFTPVAENFGKGVASQLENSLGKYVGSTFLLGEELAKALQGGIASQIISPQPKQIQAVENFLAELVEAAIGERQFAQIKTRVTQAAAAERSKSRQKSEQTKTLAEEQIVVERRQDFARAPSIFATRDEITQEIQSRQSEAESVLSKIQRLEQIKSQLQSLGSSTPDAKEVARLDRQIKRLEKIRAALVSDKQISPTDFREKNDRIQTLIQERVGKLTALRKNPGKVSEEDFLKKTLEARNLVAEYMNDQIGRDLKTFQQYEAQGLLEGNDLLTQEYERIKSTKRVTANDVSRKDTLKAFGIINSTVSQLSDYLDNLFSEASDYRKLLDRVDIQLEEIAERGAEFKKVLSKNKPEQYELIAQEVSKATGVTIASLPTLQVGKNLPRGAYGQFSADKYAIEISKEAARQLNSGQMSKKLIETLIHELIHAAQAGFGSTEGLKAYASGLMQTQGVVPTSEELKKFEPKIEKSVSGGKGVSEAASRRMETEAYVLADRLLEPVSKKLMPPDYIQKYRTSLTTLEAPVKQSIEALKTLKKSASELGIDIQSQLTETIQAIESIREHSNKVKENAQQFADAGYFSEGSQYLEDQAREIQSILEAKIKEVSAALSSDWIPETKTQPMSAGLALHNDSGEILLKGATHFTNALSSLSEGAFKTAGTLLVKGAKAFVDGSLHLIRRPGDILRVPAGIAGTAIKDSAIAGLAFTAASQVPMLQPATGMIGHIGHMVADPIVQQAVGHIAANATTAMAPVTNFLTHLPFIGSGISEGISALSSGIVSATTAVGGNVGASVLGGTAIAGAAAVPLKATSSALGSLSPSRALPPALTSLPVLLPREKELVLVQQNTEKKLKSATQAASRVMDASENIASSVSSKIENISAQIVKIQAEVTDIWSENKSEKATSVVEKAKLIQSHLQEARKSFQSAVKNGNVEFANAMGDMISNATKNAETEIRELIKGLADYGIDVSSNSPIRNTLSGVLQTITKTQKAVDKGKLKIERDRKTGQVTIETQFEQLGIYEDTQMLLGSAAEKLAELRSKINLENEQLKALAIDLGVNTAGFIGSQLGEGMVGQLSGDLVGALAARQAVFVGTAATQAHQSLSQDDTYKAATALEKLNRIIKETIKVAGSAQFRNQMGGDLTGDIMGFGVGNSAALIAHALGLQVPLVGAVAATAAVPKFRSAIQPIQEKNELESQFENFGFYSDAQDKIQLLYLRLLQKLKKIPTLSDELLNEVAKIEVDILEMPKEDFIDVQASLGILDQIVDFYPDAEAAVKNATDLSVSLQKQLLDYENMVKSTNDKYDQIESDLQDRGIYTPRTEAISTDFDKAERERLIRSKAEQDLEKAVRKSSGRKPFEEEVNSANELIAKIEKNLRLVDQLENQIGSGGGGGPGSGGFLDNLKNKIDELKNRFPVVQKAENLLKEVGSALFVGGAGFFLGNALVQFATSSFTAALEAERLKASLDFATVEGSTKVLAQIREETNRLGTSFNEAARARQSLEAASLGSSLQPQIGGILSGFQQRFAAQQLAPEAQGRVLAQVGQMIGKSRIQSEEILTASESMPGTLQAMARAMGTTTEELLKMGSAGNLLAEDILPKLGNQLELESATSAAEAAKTTSAELQRLGNNMQFLRESAGQISLSVVGQGLSLINPLLSAATANMETLGKFVLFTSVSLSGQLIVSLLKMMGIVPTLSGMVKGLGIALQTVGRVTVALAAQAAAIAALVAAWETLQIVTGNVNNEQKRFADEQEKALDRLIQKQKELNGLKGSDKRKPFESSSPVGRFVDAIPAKLLEFNDWMAEVTGVAPRPVTSAQERLDQVGEFRGPNAQLEIEQITRDINAALNDVSAQLGQIKIPAGSELQKQIEEIQNLDQKLAQLRVQRSVTALEGKPQAVLDELDKKSAEISKQRMELSNKLVGVNQQGLEGLQKDLKAQLESLISLGNFSGKDILIGELNKQLQVTEARLAQIDQITADIAERTQALAPKLIAVNAGFDASKLELDNRTTQERTTQLEKQRDLLLTNAAIQNDSLRLERETAEKTLSRLDQQKAKYEELFNSLKSTDRVALNQALGTDVSKASLEQITKVQELAQAGLIKGFTKDAEDALTVRRKIIDIQSEQIQATNGLVQAQLNEKRGLDTLSESMGRLGAAYESAQGRITRSRNQFNAALSQRRASLSVGDIGGQEQAARRDIADNRQLISDLTRSRSEYLSLLAKVTGEDRQKIEQVTGQRLEQLGNSDIDRLTRDYSLTENQKRALEAQKRAIEIGDQVTQASQAQADAQLTLVNLGRSTYRSALGMQRQLEDFNRSVEDFYLGLQKQLRDAKLQYKRSMLELQGLESQIGLSELQAAGSSNLFGPVLDFLANLQTQANQLAQQKLDLENRPLDLAEQQRNLSIQTRDLGRQFADLSLELQTFKESLRGSTPGLAGNQVTKFNRPAIAPGSLQLPPTVGMGTPSKSNQLGRNSKFNAVLQAARKAGASEPEALLMASQWALESGWGKSQSGKNNFFGIKAKPGQPGTMVKTWEDYGSGPVTEYAKFRDYATPEEGLRDRLKLTAQPRYRGVKSAQTAAEAIEAVKRGGYATDPSYVSKLISILRGQGFDPYARTGAIASLPKQPSASAPLPVPALPPIGKGGKLPSLPPLPTTDQLKIQSQSIELQGKTLDLSNQINQVNLENLDVDKQKLEAQQKLNDAQNKQKLADLLIEQKRRAEDLIAEIERGQRSITDFNQQSNLSTYTTGLQSQLAGVGESYRSLVTDLRRRQQDLQRDLSTGNAAIAAFASGNLTEFTKLTGVPAEQASAAVAILREQVPVVEEALNRLQEQIKNLNLEEARAAAERMFRAQSMGEANRGILGVQTEGLGLEAGRLNRKGDVYGASALETKSQLLQNQASFAESTVQLTEALAKLPGLSDTATAALQGLRVAALDLNIAPEEFAGFLAQIPADSEAAAQAIAALQGSLENYNLRQQETIATQRTFFGELSEGATQAASNAFGNLFGNLDEFFSGVKSGTDIVREFFLTFLQGLQDIAAQMAQQALIKFLTNIIGAAAGGFGGGGAAITSTATSAAGSGFGFASSILAGFANGGTVENYADGGVIGGATALGLAMMDAMQRESAYGVTPVPSVTHIGEEILSTRNGDAQTYRRLVHSGQWGDIKAVNNYAEGSIPAGARSRGGSGITIQNTYNLKDAGGLRETETQRAAREALAARRALGRY